MHTHSLARWTHSHAFLGSKHGENERKTWLVVLLTATMMIVEIIGGVLRIDAWPALPSLVCCG
jgi:Co/Zn/Cd efflux system component